LVSGFIHADEYHLIRPGGCGYRLSMTSFHAETGLKKRTAWHKYADRAIVFGEAVAEKIPTVVFEVGFTETYSDLKHDARQWLERSDGKVQLVILVDIKEDEGARKRIQATRESQKRVKRLARQFGNAAGKENLGLRSESDMEISDAELYDSLKSEIMTEDWIGPIRASLEMWHLHDGVVTMRGPRIVRLSLISLEFLR
jgi:hypothetical protein